MSIKLGTISLLLTTQAFADGGIVYTDVSPGTVLAAFEKVGSTITAEAAALHQQSLNVPITFDDLAFGPMMPRGLPGIAILDYDRDGDLDMYVTNGPGAANALFQNQLVQTGTMSFIDVAQTAGLAATDQDSFGTCFGDIDNDGDHDLMVLGRNEANRLYENLGNGTFQLLNSAGVAGNDLSSTSCSMGDIDNDGLLDIVVANGFDQADSLAIMLIPYDLNHPNQLLRNNGDKTFTDVSESSGILINQGYPANAHGITWAVGAVDVDSDGDADIVFTDDQAGIPAARYGGEDRAYIHVFINDGTGHFNDSALIQNAYSASEWMGVSFGDLNCDGTVDMFASSFGDYAGLALGSPYFKGASASRSFLGDGNGSFTDTGAPIADGNGGLTTDNAATAFGWGNAIYDADNDGDNDILYHGGLDAAGLSVIADNPGVLLLNQGDCSGQFIQDQLAIQTDHFTRNVRGVAVGDLDGNGFPDIATAANLTTPPQLPLLPLSITYGDPLDDSAFIVPLMTPVNAPDEPPAFVWDGFENGPGDFKLELNSGNDNGHVTIDVQGSIGLLDSGMVNRDGIGALVSFTPHRGKTSLQTIVAGSSHSSNHALRKTFGLGSDHKGTLDILWPGGSKNRLYNVRNHEHIVMPEIPCSYDADWPNQRSYRRCVSNALRGLSRQGVISHAMHARLLTSAMRAYREHNRS